MSIALEQRIKAAKREIRARSQDGVLRRTVPVTLKLRASNTNDGGYRIVGHGAVYNSMSDDLGGFKETIQPGFFDQVLASAPNVRALYNHDPNLVLAGTANGTLALNSDSMGLAYSAQVSPAVAGTYYGQALRAVLSDGLVDRSSFAFRTGTNADDWNVDDQTGDLIRTLLPNGCSALYDVSPVTYPAYPGADSQLASRSRRSRGAHSTTTVDDMHRWMAEQMRLGRA
jgi:HK97 family phage prohead protease